MYVEDLPREVGQALLRGFASWRTADGVASDPVDEGLPAKRALEDGARLGEAVALMLSADLADYATDKRRYEILAEVLGHRYGAGVVVGTDEFGPGRASPGLRTRGDVPRP